MTDRREEIARTICEHSALYHNEWAVADDVMKAIFRRIADSILALPQGETSERLTDEQVERACAVWFDEPKLRIAPHSETFKSMRRVLEQFAASQKESAQ